MPQVNSDAALRQISQNFALQPIEKGALGQPTRLFQYYINERPIFPGRITS